MRLFRGAGSAEKHPHAEGRRGEDPARSIAGESDRLGAALRAGIRLGWLRHVQCPTLVFNRLRHACLLALALAGCKHVSELQVQQHQEAASAATTETHETRSEGPEHIVMTVEEYQQLCPGEPQERSANGSAKTEPAQSDKTPAIYAPGPLIRRTITVTDRGPSLDDLRSLSSLQSKVNTALAVHEEKKSGPAGLFAALLGLWPVVLIGGAVLAGVVAFKLKPPWLGFLFKLLRRAP